MRHTPRYAITDPEEVRRLVRRHPWVTLVSPSSTGLVASHCPAILDEETSRADEIVLLSHVGRPDDEIHELGAHEVLVIVQGPHDYVSPSWYEPGEVIPTWNHVTAHLYGTPEILTAEENYAALCRLTDHFESGRAGGRSLAQDEAGTRRAARGAVGLRLRVDRFDARAKLSQNKPDTVRTRITDELQTLNPDLALEMRRATADGSRARDV